MLQMSMDSREYWMKYHGSLYRSPVNLSFFFPSKPRPNSNNVENAVLFLFELEAIWKFNYFKTWTQKLV